MKDHMATGRTSGVLHEVPPPTLLVASGLADDPEFVQQVLEGEPFELLQAEASGQIFETLQRRPVDLIILPGEDKLFSGLDCCRKLKANPRTELVPVLVVIANSIEAQIEALRAGADDFLARPFHPDLARTRMQTLLRRKAATDRLEESETILFALAQAVEHRDRATAGHCDRLGLLSLAMGKILGLPDDDLQALHRGGYLHDIGKVGMPDSILLKPGPLNESEWQTMRTHPVRGEQMCKPLRSLQRVLPIIRHHHERWDGSGYPDGLRGERIPLLARILQFADIYDALTSERPYKKALPPPQALDIMQQETDRGWRDPKLMQIFAQLHKNRLGAASGNAGVMHESLRNLQTHLIA